MIHSKYILRVKTQKGIVAIKLFLNYNEVSKYVQSNKPAEGEDYLITRIDYIGDEEISTEDNISIKFTED